MLLEGKYARPMEVANYLAISRAQVYRAIKQGTIPSIKLGSTIRVPVQALKKQLDDLEVKE